MRLTLVRWLCRRLNLMLYTDDNDGWTAWLVPDDDPWKGRRL